MKRQLSFAAIVIVMLIIAVACQDILPDVPIVRRIMTMTPTEASRGVRGIGEVGVLVDTATPTTTLRPDVYLYGPLNYIEADYNCRRLLHSTITPYPTPWEYTRTTTGEYTAANADYFVLCNTNTLPVDFGVETIGNSQGWSYSWQWWLRCRSSPALGCPDSSGLNWLPTPVISDRYCGNEYWSVYRPIENIDGQTHDFSLGGYVSSGIEGYNVASIDMQSNSLHFEFCPALSYHGFKLVVTSTPTPSGSCNCDVSDVCIVEINAMQDATPTTSAMLDYNLRGLQGANDEYVEVVCCDPMSAAGWSLSDGTSSYTYESDNFCWPLKAIFCDEMLDCDLDTGFPDSGTWQLYDPDGNLKDQRSYPVMATPGNSWAAADYLVPDGVWVEIKPHPGTFPTNTATATNTPTLTPTPTDTPTPTVTPTPTNTPT